MLNAWGGREWDALRPWLASLSPDVLCLQEVIRTPSAGAVWLRYADAERDLRQRANLFGEVADLLPGHDATFVCSSRGPLSDGTREHMTDWGLATFVDQRHLVIGQAQDFVHGDFAEGGFGQGVRPRAAHAVRLRTAGGRRLVVAHLHGLRDPDAGKADTPERRAQAERLTAMVRSLARPGDGVVVCGDLNVEPEGETLALLSAGLGLTELVRAHGHAGTRTPLYPGKGAFADYMLVGRADVRAFDVVRDPVVSDHCPLVLDLR